LSGHAFLDMQMDKKGAGSEKESAVSCNDSEMKITLEKPSALLT